MWRIVGRYQHPETGADHCPGGCYKFFLEDTPQLGNLHVPVDMFWGRTPWRWWRGARP